MAGTACGTFGLWVYLCSTQGAPISTSYLKLDSAMVSSHLVVISKCPVQAICNTTHVIIQTTAYYSRIACVHEIIDNKREPDQQEISCPNTERARSISHTSNPRCTPGLCGDSNSQKAAEDHTPPSRSADDNKLCK